MKHNYYEEDYDIITDDEAKAIADGLEEFTKTYLRFIIPNIRDTKLKKYFKRLKKMIKKIRDKDKRKEVFNMKMVRLVKEDSDDSRLY